MGDVCQQCGNEYQRIGHHWSQSTCSFPPLSNFQHDVLVGSLMGDGTLDVQNGRNPRITIAVQEKKYIQLLSSLLGIMSGDVYKSNGLWWLSTRQTPELCMYNTWYLRGEKEWPNSIELTPTVLRHLYCQDGSRQNKIARVCTKNEQSNREKVNKIITNVGLPRPVWDCDQFRWSVEDSKTVFEYMRKTCPGYEYKWPEQYRQS